MPNLLNWLPWKRRRLEQDLDRELRYHVDRRVEDLKGSGMSDAEARRAAALELGGIVQVQEQVRDTWIWRSLDHVGRDVRYAGRGLLRNPGFTVVALVTLALGIGANTAIFSIVNGVILQPLVYPEPGQLMRLTTQFPLLGSAGGGLSHPEYTEFREMNRLFAHLGAFSTGKANTGGGGGAWAGEVNISAGDRPLRVRSAAVDDHLALGVQPAHGRFFAPGETDAMAARPGLGGPPLAILSHELWQSAFGGQPAVGQTVNVDGRPHDVIGIMPPGVDLMDTRPEIWLPLGIHPEIRRIRTSHLLSVIGRLKDGVTLQAAQTELTLLLENWSERAGAKGHVPTRRGSRAEDHLLQLQPLQDAIVGDARRAIWVLQGAVGLVLLIVCANLANLAMARAESRRREFAMRTALGASRGRLLQQATTEGVLLSVAGGVIGLWLAHAGIQAMRLRYPTSLPRASQLEIDLPVLLFALVVSMGTGVLFGLAPAAQIWARDLVAAIKDGGDRSAAGGRQRMRRALVVAEVALAMMLVTSAGLLLRTVYNLTRVDAGFDRSRLVTFSMTLPTSLPPAALSQTLERAVREADPSVPIVRLREMDAVFADSIRRPRLLAQLLGAFAGLALLLAAVGTYGVLSCMVAERRREIGVRMALGAARSSVIGLVMKGGLQATGIGIVAGVAGTFVVNRLLATLLFGVRPTDSATLAAVIAVITVVATVACALPAWRAASVSPTEALRLE